MTTTEVAGNEAATNAAASGSGGDAAGAGKGNTGSGSGGGTAAAGGASGDGKPAAGAAASGDGAKGYWPDDWRAKVAGEDAKVLERLGRYASPGEVAKALIAAQEKIRSGELKPTLGKNASAEEVAEYRKSLGIPEEAGKYDLDLGGGLVVAEEDRPLIDTFLEAAHRTNQTPDQVKAGLRAYYEITEAAEAERTRRDEETRGTAEDALRTEWGQEYRPNVNRITQLLDKVLDVDAKAEFINARLADGTPVFNHPGILKALVGLALIDNPSGVVVPGGGGEKTVNDRIEQIEKMMGTKAYTSNEAIQKEYRDLIEARETIAKRK